MEKIFKGEKIIDKSYFNRVPKDVLEKDFIIEFLKELPFESLKKLVSFHDINPENEDLWKDIRLIDILRELKSRRQIRFRCQLKIDVED
jgi:hypothetical protein